MNTRSCAVRGHIVFDRTPIRMPRSRSSRSTGAASGSVSVCGSQVSKYPAISSSVGSTPARSIICASVALVCAVAVACHSSCSAAQMAAATPAACPSGKCGVHTARHNCSWSMVCQGVSVPPQLKMTARTATLTTIPRSPTDTALSFSLPGGTRHGLNPRPSER